jgi:hypothetical protein
MLFSNEGKRTGSIGQLRIIVDYGNGDRHFMIDPHTDDDAAIFVEAEKTIGAKLLFMGGRIHWDPDNASDDLEALVSRPEVMNLNDVSCYLYVHGFNSDGSPYLSCVKDAFRVLPRILRDRISQMSEPQKEKK